MKVFLMQNGAQFELEDPYKAFKDKLKAQIKGKNDK